MTTSAPNTAAVNHNDLICFDGLQYSRWFGVADTDAHSFIPDFELIDEWRKGGITGVNVTSALFEDARAAMNKVMRWHRLIRAMPERLMLGLSADDLPHAKKTGRTAIYIGFQNTSPFEDDHALVEAFYLMGVRIAQLTYNIQNFVGSSCYEIVDGGLTRFGRLVVEEMNRLGMVIDVSHVGQRTTLDAVAHSSRPIAATHANPAFFVKHPRSKSDEVLRAISGRGGLVGVTTYAPLLGGTHVTLSDWCDMIVRLSDLIGIEHVAIGSDTSLRWSDADLLSMNVARWSHTENWGSNLPGKTGWSAPLDWYHTSNDFPRLTEALTRRGLASDEVTGVMGGNWQRFLAAVDRSG